MSNPGFTTTFSVDKPPSAVFDAITDVRGWWSENIDGPTDTVGGEFTYAYEDVHRCRIRVTDLVPGRRVSWLVVENYFDFVSDRTEWTGTRVHFDLAEHDGGTQIRFTHEGLVPAYECYDVCSTSWGFYVNSSLHDLITTGEGRPNGPGTPRVAAEEQLSAGIYR